MWKLPAAKQTQGSDPGSPALTLTIILELLGTEGGEGPELTLPFGSVSDVLLKESKWTKMFFGEGQASLSFSHLNKDDEGLYTLRIVSRGGVSDHSAFMFVRGASAGMRVGSQEKAGGSYIAGGDREETQESGW